MIFKTLIITICLSFLATDALFAANLSKSATEVDYHFSTSFRSFYKVESMSAMSVERLAVMHAEHIFALFHSPEVAEQNGFPAELTEGYAGTKHPSITDVNVSMRPGDDYLWVTYSAKGKVLILNAVFNNMFGSQTETDIQLPMLADLNLVYSPDMKKFVNPDFVKCTDPSFPEPYDFSYFYSIFRCPEFATAPIAQDVTFHLKVTEGNAEKRDTLVPLPAIRGDNGNGQLTVLYFINGFDSTPPPGSSHKKITNDEGWKLYNKLGKRLVDYFGFEKVESVKELRELLGDDFNRLKLQTEVSLKHDAQRRFFSTYVRVDKGRIWVVRSGVFDTENKVSKKPLITLPKFWKEAWENGDFIYFGGHSGDGASLSMDNTLANLRTADISNIEFNPEKMQIVFIDACSSYAHYQDLYAEEKGYKNLNLLTYGVVSLYHTAEVTSRNMLDLIIAGHDDLTWMKAMENVERDQLRPHINFLYSDQEQPEIDKVYNGYLSKGFYPTLLLSVWVP